MSGRLAGKVAVITGSTGGLGEGIARRLAGEGASVVVSGRRTEEGEAVVRTIVGAGGRAVFQRADIAREEDCLALIQTAKDAFGRLDILVNNAAALANHPVDEITAEEWDAAYITNVRGPFLCCRAAIALMREQGEGGSLINIGTTMAYRGSISGNLDRLAYATSKGALLTLTRALAGPLLADRIRSNWITVGWVATPQEIALRNRTHGDGEAFLKETAEKRAIGRHETPEDIAAGVAYLASDEASHVTGGELNLSGGLWIG